MKRNESTLDRIFRVVTGILIISIVFVGPKSNWGWIGIVPLLTGLIGWCPIYAMLGMSTCDKKKKLL